MVETVQIVDIAALPPAPNNPLPYRQQITAIRAYFTGTEALRDAGGPVTRCTLAPKWITPPIVVVTSPKGAHDVLGRTDGFVDKALPIYDEVRRISAATCSTSPTMPGCRGGGRCSRSSPNSMSPSSPGIWPRPPKGFQCAGQTAPRLTSTANATR
jgi:hypothetical protein